jgi:hypothetical protein
MPPLWQVLLASAKEKADDRIFAPKRASIIASSGFWLNHAVPGDQEGRGHHHRPLSRPAGKGHAPLWQYFSRLSRSYDACRAPCCGAAESAAAGSCESGRGGAIAQTAKAMRPLWQYLDPLQIAENAA